MHRVIASLLRLPIVSFFSWLIGLRVQQVAWLPSYALLNGAFFQHAMSTPITVLAGCLDASLEQGAADAQMLQQARQVCTAVEQLLRKLASPHSTAEKFSVQSVTQASVALCRMLHPAATIAFHQACSSETYLIGSAIHWQEAIHCAVRNAIEAYSQTETYYPVTVLLYETAHSVRLEIIDYAGGMTSMRRLLVQVPGLSNKQTGTGLGLPFVHYVVEELFSGRVEIESTVGRGTHIRWVIER